MRARLHFAERGSLRASSGAAAAGSEPRRVQNFIAGRLAWPGEGLPLVNPSTGQSDGLVASSTAACVDEAVAAAKVACAEGAPWPSMALEARCSALQRLARRLEDRAEDFVLAESRDQGKPQALARALDVPRSVHNINFFAGLAPHVAGEVRGASGPMQSMSYTITKPIGVVGIVVPWNLPLYLLTWKLAPALAMGNAVVIKPSEVTPTTALMLAELCVEVGIPDGVVNVVNGLGGVAGQALVGHPDVSAVSFTGGTATGAMVAATAAQQFKKLSLELGGKNAAVVFDDCSFDDTVEGVARSAFLNSGQICLCSSRIFVQRGKDGAFYDRFIAALIERVKALKVGRPENSDTDLGPLVSEPHFKKVCTAVDVALAEGGNVLCGGKALPELSSTGEGFFYAPTVIDGLSPSSVTSQGEIFGPVVTVHPFEDDAEAIALANNTRYGLSASLWTESMARAERAEDLHAGTIWVNTWLNRELHMPFGGVKDSGVNREGGAKSLDFYSEISTVCVKRGSRRSLPMPGAGGR